MNGVLLALRTGVLKGVPNALASETRDRLDPLGLFNHKRGFRLIVEPFSGYHSAAREKVIAITKVGPSDFPTTHHHVCGHILKLPVRVNGTARKKND